MQMRRRRKKVLVNLPTIQVKNLDDLAEESDMDRSEVVEQIVDHFVHNAQLLDEVFGELKNEEEEDEGEEESHEVEREEADEESA
jgi:metal-responsive CopG/Arc/MetJ family transcriptional regulator